MYVDDHGSVFGRCCSRGGSDGAHGDGSGRRGAGDCSGGGGQNVAVPTRFRETLATETAAAAATGHIERALGCGGDVPAVVPERFPIHAAAVFDVDVTETLFWTPTGVPAAAAAGRRVVPGARDAANETLVQQIPDARLLRLLRSANRIAVVIPLDRGLQIFIGRRSGRHAARDPRNPIATEYGREHARPRRSLQTAHARFRRIAHFPTRDTLAPEANGTPVLLAWIAAVGLTAVRQFVWFPRHVCRILVI